MTAIQIKPKKLNFDRINFLYRDKRHTIEEVAREIGISFWSLYDFMKQHGIDRRDHSEAGYLSNRSKPHFNAKLNLSVAEEELKTAGIMLYWAEGTLKGNTVDFVNSNPCMVKLFLEFLRRICGIKEERLRLYIYAYSYNDLEEIKNYWRKITGIPFAQFTKPYIREGTPNKNNRILPYGLVHVRYNDKELLKLIKNWIQGYVTKISIWTGTQAAKGGRLFKAASCRKTG